MDATEKLAVVERILDDAADELGDPTPLVLERFHRAFPAGKALFCHHGGRNSSRMEADMVRSVLYCVMIWFERPAEVEIMFNHTIPHHEMLNIDTGYFSGLLAATLDVIGETLPAGDETRQAVWSELETQLLVLVEASSLASLGFSPSREPAVPGTRPGPVA
jgi:hypothetical protein